ncbi:MAG: hypothetical protein IKW01_01360 [Firmicutes bacterium]|nr:hypothetical protein [Bacillota bacterium]
MNILENKFICIILMILLMAGGLFVGGMKGLNGLYSDVEDVFFLGIDRDGIGVANDMTERFNSASNMVTIARKYEASAPEIYRQAIAHVSSAAASLDSALASKDIVNAIAANKSLDLSVSDLYREMGTLILSAQDEKYRQSLYADFNSRNDTISHDPYNSYAEEYTQALRSFPASLISSVMPVKGALVAY